MNCPKFLIWNIWHDFRGWSDLSGLKSLPVCRTWLFCSQLGSSLGWGSSDVCETICAPSVSQLSSAVPDHDAYVGKSPPGGPVRGIIYLVWPGQAPGSHWRRWSVAQSVAEEQENILLNLLPTKNRIWEKYTAGYWSKEMDRQIEGYFHMSLLLRHDNLLALDCGKSQKVNKVYLD